MNLKGICQHCSSKNIKKSSTYPQYYFCLDCKDGALISSLNSNSLLVTGINKINKIMSGGFHTPSLNLLTTENFLVSSRDASISLASEFLRNGSPVNFMSFGGYEKTIINRFHASLANVELSDINNISILSSAQKDRITKELGKYTNKFEIKCFDSERDFRTNLLTFRNEVAVQSKDFKVFFIANLETYLSNIHELISELETLKRKHGCTFFATFNYEKISSENREAIKDWFSTVIVLEQNEDEYRDNVFRLKFEKISNKKVSAKSFSVVDVRIHPTKIRFFEH